MAKPTLEGLPPELLDAVVSFILRPTCLKSLCLTSKRLLAIATPHLYHEVIVDIEMTPKKPRLFKPGHRGHPFVRYLVFRADEYMYDDDTARSAESLVMSALEVIPTDKLRGFTTSSDLALTYDTIIKLCTYQRQLESISIGSTRDGRLSMIAEPRDWLAHLTDLYVPSKLLHLRELDYYGNIIANIGTLKRLHLHSPRLVASDNPLSNHMILDDTEESDGLYFTKLFGHLLPQPTDDRSQLTGQIMLELFSVRYALLAYADRNLAKVIAFEKLRELNLFYCVAVSPFLLALRNTFRSKGSSLRVLRYQGVSTSDDIMAVNDFLNSFTGLTFLKLIDRYFAENLDMTCIHAHAESLLYLMIGIGTNDRAYDREHLRLDAQQCKDLCSRCSKLRQIAIALPVIKVNEAGDDASNWRSYAEVLVSPHSRHLSFMLILAARTRPGAATRGTTYTHVADGDKGASSQGSLR